MSNLSEQPPDSVTTDLELVRRLGRVGGAFFGNFDALRPGQRLAIDPVLNGENVLIAASTASGKTEAILAPLVARLIQKKRQGRRIRLLIITPTRALVNDLLRRLEGPLSSLGWECGAQTSDHRDRKSQPHVLITTPESFDSTLIAGFDLDDSRKPMDHWLSDVEAIFFDEAHLYYGTPRGDQVCFLVNRLRRIKARYRPPHDPLQLCGASATAGDETRVASWLLGKNSLVVRATDRRLIQILSRRGEWIDCSGDDAPESILAALPTNSDSNVLAEFIERERKNNALRKWLVFVPSRSLCDQLTLDLRETLGSKLGIWVGAHHSSLPRNQREEAEQRFGRDRDAVLIATSTLEVGVDIGDVDVVAQIGCPSSASSLLQRIGRGNRRERNRTRLVAMPRNHVEARAFVGILRSAVSGNLPSIPAPRFWAVFVQQTLAFIQQAHGQGRTHAALIELAKNTWPEGDTPARAKAILEQLVADGVLNVRRGMLHLSDATFESYGAAGALLANFDGAGATTAVVDQLTGEVFANVMRQHLETPNIIVAGKRLQITSQVDGRVEVRRDQSSGASPSSITPRYSARRMPTTAEFAAALRDGCGFSPESAPLLTIGAQTLWFHFGGEIWERLLKNGPLQGIFPRVLIPGVALEIALSANDFSTVRFPIDLLESAFHSAHSSLATVIELGRFKNHLTGDHLRDAVRDAIHLPGWVDWAATREVSQLKTTDPRRNVLHSLLSA